MVACGHFPLLSHDVDCATMTARAEVSRRMRLGHFAITDRDDVVQDLLIGIVARWPRWNSERGRPATFFSVVVRREASSLVRARRTAKRGGGRVPVSLDTCIERNEQLHPRDEGDGDPARFDLQHDARAVVDDLPPELQPFARAMMTQSPSAAARSLGLSRRVAAEQMARIRERFVEAGLEA